VRYGKSLGNENDSDIRTIKTIAVCAGSGINFEQNRQLSNCSPQFIGGSVFAGVVADLFVTGEMGHHQVLEICDRQNAHVLLTEHSNCERGYLRDVFVPLLKEKLTSNDSNLDSVFEVVFSNVDIHDPLTII
jgi:putative NIF3 family GTP cyclohydrolase 1 type 2